MSQVSYDLFYFPVWKALADPTRLMLALAGAKHTSTATMMSPEDKAQQRFGKVPRLTVQVEGKETSLWESRPINEYVALEFGFLPKDSLARADLLSFVYSIYEIGDTFGATSALPTPELRKEHWLKTRETTLNVALALHEKYLASRSGDGPFYAGAKITLPDIVLYTSYIRWSDMFGVDVISEKTTPHLRSLIKACEEGKPGEVVRSWSTQFKVMKFDAELIKWAISS